MLRTYVHLISDGRSLVSGAERTCLQFRLLWDQTLYHVLGAMTWFSVVINCVI